VAEGSADINLPKRVSANPEAGALWKRQYAALLEGRVIPECLEEANLQCLDYFPMTLLMGRALEQVGRQPAPALFLLAGKLFPYLGIRWLQSGKCRPDPASRGGTGEGGNSAGLDRFLSEAARRGYFGAGH
jgi:hypothetical protein